MKAQYLSVPLQSNTSRAIDLATSDGHSSRMALRNELINMIQWGTHWEWGAY